MKRPGAVRRLLMAVFAVCMLVLGFCGSTGAGEAAAESVPAASAPGQWASLCDSQTLGLGQDTVQLAPVLPTEKSPSGGHVVSQPASGGKWVPVVMVHGWTSQDTNTPARTGAFSHFIDLSDIPGFTPDVGRSLIGQLQGIPGAAVFTFDYHPYSARWVDDSHLGPALGKVIDCLYRASGQKVIIVAHSMGGLVARYAATQPGLTGSNRAGEISTVVTFGTPETGSVAALLAETGVDLGAPTDDLLATIRLILAACGQLAGNQIQTGTLCDELPPPVRTFESASGIALRYGSAELAALKPWPRPIDVDALAGNATFELPDPGWFSLPWSTTSVDVGDLIVTPSSALAGATHTMNAACDYQLNPVRGVTDQLGLSFGLAARTQVAQQPLKAFTGACFHTDLMRGIELTNEALGAVAADIRSRFSVTATDLLSAPVPAVCRHPAGRLVDGAQPGIPGNQGTMALAWLHHGAAAKAALTAFGDLSGNGSGDAATLLNCNAGGVAWPQVVAFYSPGPTLLGWAYLTDFNLPGIPPEENASAYKITYHDGGIDIEWSTQEPGDPGAIDSLDYSATLRLSGHRIVASNLAGTTELQAVDTFLNDLRHGDQAAASQLAAPGVGAQTASLFRAYPSALTATPKCYGTNDLNMPAPLAALIEAGGSQQVNQNTQRLCALPSTDPGANWVALGLQHTGFRTWQILWSQSA
jgi:pimeloyl-ACP methyl ester carboxylesterase